MALNPLEELMASPKSNKPSKDSKDKKKSIKANPIFKELKPLMYFSSFAVVGIVVASFTIFDDSKEYHYKHLTEGMELTETNISNMERDISSIAKMESERNKLNELVTERERELSDANLVRTPLEQSFYFTAYLDALIKKHNIDLKDMYVKASRTETGEEIDLAVATQLPTSGYNLLPMYVEFESSYQNVENLFNDFYTKRIVYDEDLIITNKNDGTINVKMTVKFEKETGGQPIEGEQQTQPITDPNAIQQGIQNPPVQQTVPQETGTVPTQQPVQPQQPVQQQPVQPVAQETGE